jgi:hypothetical protein
MNSNESPAWRHSLAVKLFGVVFLATHVPLLCLIGVVTFRPDWLTPAGVLALATTATLLATGLVFYVMWRFLQPLRQAADGLQAYMKHGTALQLKEGGEDEVARLLRLLVRALGHLDRARVPLLHSSALALRSEVHAARTLQGATIHTVILAEVNEWDVIEASRDVRLLEEVQQALVRRLQERAPPEATVLPWGRGRCLMVLSAAHRDRAALLRELGATLRVPSQAGGFQLSVVHADCGNGAAGWSAALQRLDQRMFALRAGITQPA